jgi:hypothetical protein
MLAPGTKLGQHEVLGPTGAGGMGDELGAKHLVSSGGGVHPVWSAGGRELYYRGRTDVSAVEYLSVSFHNDVRASGR